MLAVACFGGDGSSTLEGEPNLDRLEEEGFVFVWRLVAPVRGSAGNTYPTLDGFLGVLRRPGIACRASFQFGAALTGWLAHLKPVKTAKPMLSAWGGRVAGCFRDFRSSGCRSAGIVGIAPSGPGFTSCRVEV